MLFSPVDQPTDLNAFGFGTNGPTLTLQRTDSETGCVTPNGSDPVLGCSGTVFASNFTDSTSPSAYVAPPGPPKYNETTLNALGITNLSQFGILFNANENQPNSDDVLTVTNLAIRFYDANNNPVGDTISLTGAVTLSNVSAGQGSAGFVFGINPDQYGLTGCDADGTVSAAGCGAYHLGIAATITGTGGGADSFTFGNIGDAFGTPGGDQVPEPVSALMIGTGLIGAAMLMKRRANQ